MVKNNKELVGIIFGAMVFVTLFGGSGAFAAETPYSIIYDSGVVTDMPTDEDSKTMNDTVQISSSKPKRTGLSFYGWCNTVPTNVDGNDTCSGTTFTIGGDWSIDPTTVNNNLRLYAMWGEERPEPQPSTAGCINYFANASDAVGTMGCQSATDGASLDLLASNFSRTGYGFAGWSDSFDYATNSNAKFYGPMETITVPTGTTANGLSLYAVWVKSEGNLQDTNKVTALCGTNGTGGSLATAPIDGTANLSSVSALTDQRDNNTYAIAKLADGKCWMIENLRLQNTGTDNTNGSLAQGYGGQFAGLADPEAPWANNITTANTLYSTDGADDTINIGASSAGSRFPRYNNTNTPTATSDRPQNPTSNSSTNTTTNAGMYSYGNYYTWAAAIADTSAYTTNNQSVTNNSICPAGWRLPRGGDKTRIESDRDNEFWNLTVIALNNNTLPANYSSSTNPYYTGTSEAGPVANLLRSYPNNYLYSGYVYSGLLSSRGSYGRYWSSTTDSIDANGLGLNSSSVYPGTNGSYKSNGRAVRCIAQ